MSLLEFLFPGLSERKEMIVPDWSFFDFPWEILESSENGLTSQISKISSEGVHIHHSSKIGDNVEIESPCFIGPNAQVRHGAYLRSGCWISEGAVVGHSTEVKNSILLPGAKAPHFNYVGDSIMGFDSNIGAGVKLSNVRNDKRNVRLVLSDGTFVDSGSMKLGALIGDGSMLGCNTVTNPGTIIAPSASISPNMTISGWFNAKS